MLELQKETWKKVHKNNYEVKSCSKQLYRYEEQCFTQFANTIVNKYNAVVIVFIVHYLLYILFAFLFIFNIGNT